MPVEILRVAEDSKITLPNQELQHILSNWFRAYVQGSLPEIKNQFGVEGISIFPVRLELQGEIGLIPGGY